MTNEFEESLSPKARDLRGDIPLAGDFFELQPAAGPVTEAASPASPDRTVLARDRVKIEPVEEWVTVHDVDFAAPAKAGGSEMLLIDFQTHAGRRAGYTRRVLRLATFDEVQQAAKWQLAFNPALQTVSLHSIRLRRGAETLERANLAKMQFLQREQGLSGNESIDGDITLLLILEDVRLGDILDVAFTIVTTPPILAHRYSGFWETAFQFPVREYMIRLRFPPEMEMRWKSHPSDVPPASQTIGGETEWSWQWKNAAAAEIEPGTPWWHFNGGWVQVSSCPSWEEIVGGFTSVWERSFDEEELDQTARRLAASASSAAECVEKALELVQDEIRYLSMNIDLGGHVPADPSSTLRRRFGDCKDKSFLLAHLLRRLGHSARPVLVHTKLDRMLEKLLPSPYMFDHVVVEFEFEGRRRWVDATLDMQGGGVLARYVSHVRRGLPIGPGVVGLEKLPKSGAEAPPYYGLRETFRLGALGQPVRLKVELTLRGAEADEQRRRLHHRGEAGVSHEREQWYGALFAGARRIRPLEWQDDREKNELLMAEAFELPQAMRPIPADGRVLFEHCPYLIRRMLSTPVRTEPRRLPLALGFPRRVEHTIELDWATLPRAEGRRGRERNSYFRFSLEENRAMSRWSSRYEFELFADSLSPADLPRFERFVNAIVGVLYIGIIGPKGITAYARPWTGSLLHASLRASGSGGASGQTTAGAGAPAGAPPAGGVPLPDKPAEALLSGVADEPPPKVEPAKPKVQRPAMVKPVRAIETEISRDLLAEPRRRRRRHREPWPMAVKVALVFVAIVAGLAVLAIALFYSVGGFG